MARQPIAEYESIEDEPNDVRVGDDASHVAEAALDPDDGWMDVTDPANPRELSFTPTWFERLPS